MKITTQADVRRFFWDEYGMLVSRKRGKNGDYSTDTRCAFVDFVDALCRDGVISEALAARVTL